MANYKKASVVVIAAATGSQVISNASSAVPLQFTVTSDQINTQQASSFDGTTFTTPYTGFYQINFSLYWSGVAQSAGFVAVNRVSDFVQLATLINGAMGAVEIANVTRVLALTKGDQIRLYCAQTTGGNATPGTGATTLSIVRVGNAS